MLTSGGARDTGDRTPDLDAELDRLQARMPPPIARFIGWLRRPTSALIRIPVGGLLVVGGLASFLPFLGIWMLPLGLVMLAEDIPALRPPLARALAWINRRLGF